METSSRVRDIIEVKLADALKALGIEYGSGSYPLEYPAEMAHGDYATGAALKYAKQAGKSPRDLAQAIVEKLGAIEGVEKIEIAGPGFVNFTLAPGAIAASIEEARTREEWGAGQARAEKTVMIEYTQPNPFKQFHIGHLMSNAIGEASARLLEAAGAKVIRANYQGDVGPHVAKAIYILLEKGITDPTLEDIAAAYVEGSTRYEAVSEDKVAINELNKRIYDRSDPEANELYAKGRALTLARFEELYAILGTKFDFYFFESDTGPLGLEIVRSHPDIFVQSEGAIVFPGEQYGLHTRVFITSLGTPTYEAKDLGNAKLKSDTVDFDESIIITASEQTDYFRVVKKALELVMPEIGAKTSHIAHGMMRFAEGKMSSRKGNIITGESLIADLTAEAKSRAAESRAHDPEKLAQQIAVAAIKYQILRQASGKDIVFEPERALSLEGDSGPYLQYAYARTRALMDRATVAGIKPQADPAAAPIEATRLLGRFPEVVAYAASELQPHLLTTYLLELASAFNSWYGQQQILDHTSADAHRMAIVEAVSQTLKKGLNILAIPTPERM